MGVTVSRHRTMSGHFLLFKPGEPWIGHDDQRIILTTGEATYTAAQLALATASQRPRIVTLCGSTRFGAAFQEANLRETLAGRIVLSIGCDMKSDAELFEPMSDEARDALKQRLDDLHKRKIDISDEVLILNVGGYIGNSTRSELEYARAHGKVVRWLEPEHAAESEAR